MIIDRLNYNRFDEFDIFSRLIIDKFSINLKNSDFLDYSCYLYNKRIFLEFNYSILKENDFIIFDKLNNYIKTFSDLIFYVESSSLHKNCVKYVISIPLVGYTKIYNHLEIELNSKKYNL